jgi:hypothetical protein
VIHARRLDRRSALAVGWVGRARRPLDEGLLAGTVDVVLDALA